VLYPAALALRPTAAAEADDTTDQEA
jgi:hypothetical protein